MSNIYLLEPHTNGKVILHTSYGDISIELWPKEAPKACRNFVQLCMEGYYNDTIFHRIVAGFIIQGGDPEGTGMGGESCFEGGEPFADEFHSRLRFVRRGLVAMANSGVPNDNKSQFFITLDATMELQNKHTIFGKIAGDTIFNVLKIGGLEVDGNERPLYPPKINSCTIVVNPFDDIVPRISRQEQEAARLKELEAQKKPEKQKKLKKNVALLSFADDVPDLTEDQEDNGDGDGAKKAKKKMLSSHDLLKDDPTLSREVDTSLVSAADERERSDTKDKKRRAKEDDRKETEHTDRDQKKRRDVEKEEEEEEEENEGANAFDQRMRDQIREKHKKSKLAKESASSSTSAPESTTTPTATAIKPSDTESAPPLSESERRRQEIQKLESDIRKMHNRDGDNDADAKKNAKKQKVSLLQQQREQYKTRGEKKGGSKKSKSAMEEKEKHLLEELSTFEAKVFSSAREAEPNPAPKRNDGPPCEIHGIPSCESCQDTISKKAKTKKATSDDEEGGGEDGEVESDSDNDIGWMQHKLVFEKDLKGKEVSLSAKKDDADDYIVIDPLNKAASTTAALAIEQQKRLDKIRKEKRFSSDSKHSGGNSGGTGRSYQPTSSNSASSRHDKPYDRSSSSSYRKDESKRSSGYDRDDRGGRYSRDSRDNRDSRDSRNSRDSRDSRDRDRW
ncbi:Peptidyl-prolyl isomerase cwc27 [Mortierella sp. AD094]|nr:Peptidyl-prolyl isomerase cwc27 [Mortierella sp. AD094]